MSMRILLGFILSLAIVVWILTAGSVEKIEAPSPSESKAYVEMGLAERGDIIETQKNVFCVIQNDYISQYDKRCYTLDIDYPPTVRPKVLWLASSNSRAIICADEVRVFRRKNRDGSINVAWQVATQAYISQYAK